MRLDLPSDNLTEQGTNKHCAVFLKALTTCASAAPRLRRKLPRKKHACGRGVTADYQPRSGVGCMRLLGGPTKELRFNNKKKLDYVRIYFNSKTS
jgi:hypothetical protein